MRSARGIPGPALGVALSLALGVALGLGTACGAPELYHWGGYEASLHKLMKEPASLPSHGEALKALIRTGEARNKLPPGIYAEYGQVLALTGKHQEAIPWFEKEKARWPESAVFMDRMIRYCHAPAPSSPKVP